ncbi:MAG: hypothetical protein IJ679_10555 [Lachnospiraceae bacterium]|nr:hypothetical protein [Lachnospiraceae bacterium]
MQNPFTTTYSRLPKYTYISTPQTAEIIENFSYPIPSEAVYKVTGLRGSGKTVILSRIIDEISKDEGWLVYSLNPARDMLRQMAALLYGERMFKKEVDSRSFGVNASILGTGGGISYSSSIGDKYFDYGAELKKMLKVVRDANKKVLLCVDEVSKTKEMVMFSLEFGDWLIEGYPVYLVCTGLYENVLELGNTKNLTFFRRGTTIRTAPLNFVRMAEMYKNRLSVQPEIAQEMSHITKGYAYAFQELGVMYFKKASDERLTDIIPMLKENLFSYSYEKIWEELSQGDRQMVHLLTEKEEYTRREVMEAMGDRAGNYSVYRDRLLKKGLLSARQGSISLYPPFFGEYVREYYPQAKEAEGTWG